MKLVPLISRTLHVEVFATLYDVSTSPIAEYNASVDGCQVFSCILPSTCQPRNIDAYLTESLFRQSNSVTPPPRPRIHFVPMPIGKPVTHKRLTEIKP